MKSKLTDIKFKKGDHIFVTMKSYDQHDMDKTIDEISELINKGDSNEALRRYEGIILDLILDYIRDNSTLAIYIPELKQLMEEVKASPRINTDGKSEKAIMKFSLDLLHDEAAIEYFINKYKIRASNQEVDRKYRDLELTDKLDTNLSKEEIIKEISNEITRDNVTSFLKSFFNVHMSVNHKVNRPN